MRAEIQLFLKRYAEASSGAADILREDTGNAEAFYLRGRALYYQSKFDQVRIALCIASTLRVTFGTLISSRH